MTNLARLLVPLTGVLLATPSPAQPGRRASRIEPLRSTFEPSLDRMKAKMVCKAGWSATAARAPDGMSYTVETCADANQQLLIRAGKVFGVGITLAARVDARRSETVMKEWTDELSVTCTAKRRTGQLSLFACADDLLVAVLSSWSSADDTHTVSILFGDPIQLGRALGLE